MRPRCFGPVAALLSTACLPYVVASSATPTPVGEVQALAPVYLIPDAVKIDEARRTPAMGFDFEGRFGVSRRADVGIRVPTLSGVVASYKHLLTDPGNATGVALMPSAGYLMGYGYGDLTSIASGPVGQVSWYGGLRVMGTTPLRDSLSRHGAIFGAFLGLKLPARGRLVLPEIGVFRGPPGLTSSRPRFNVVVAVSVSGTEPFSRPQPRTRPDRPPFPTRRPEQGAALRPAPCSSTAPGIPHRSGKCPAASIRCTSAGLGRCSGRCSWR